MTHLAAQAAENLAKIREQKPLIHNITNFVVMNYTANVLLATGASPVMAHAEQEVEEMVSFAGALVLNIGTLTDPWVEAMVKAGKKANALGIPIVLDPVGSGATSYRTRSTRKLIEELDIAIIRGNASEILSLSTHQAATTATKGVDSVHAVNQIAGTTVELARLLHTTLAVTGPIDLITDGTEVLEVANGHQLMPYVTGTGCSASAVIGAFAAVDPDTVQAAATALAFFGLAGERGGKSAQGPGSFMTQMTDALYLLSPEQLQQGCRITVQ